LKRNGTSGAGIGRLASYRQGAEEESKLLGHSHVDAPKIIKATGGGGGRGVTREAQRQTGRCVGTAIGHTVDTKIVACTSDASAQPQSSDVPWIRIEGGRATFSSLNAYKLLEHLGHNAEVM